MQCSGQNGSVKVLANGTQPTAVFVDRSPEFSLNDGRVSFSVRCGASIIGRCGRATGRGVGRGGSYQGWMPAFNLQ